MAGHGLLRDQRPKQPDLLGTISDGKWKRFRTQRRKTYLDVIAGLCQGKLRETEMKIDLAWNLGEARRFLEGKTRAWQRARGIVLAWRRSGM